MTLRLVSLLGALVLTIAGLGATTAQASTPNRKVKVTATDYKFVSGSAPRVLASLDDSSGRSGDPTRPPSVRTMVGNEAARQPGSGD